VLPLDEITRLAALKGQDINEAKKVLATEATALVHGRDAADRAAGTARSTFEQGQTSLALPTVTVLRQDLAAGIGILSAFVTAKLAASNGEVRRAIANNAVAVNDTRISSDKHVIKASDLNADGVIKLSLGKKQHVLLKPA
jgi:tyrosyl-tRNA synthetase